MDILAQGISVEPGRARTAPGGGGLIIRAEEEEKTGWRYRQAECGLDQGRRSQL